MFNLYVLYQVALVPHHLLALFGGLVERLDDRVGGDLGVGEPLEQRVRLEMFDHPEMEVDLTVSARHGGHTREEGQERKKAEQTTRRLKTGYCG